MKQRKNTEQRRREILWLSSVYGLILALAALLEILGQNGLYLMRFCFYPALALCGLVTAYWLWLCYKRGNRRCRSLLVAFGTLSALAVVDGLSSQYRIFSWHTDALDRSAIWVAKQVFTASILRDLTNNLFSTSKRYLLR